MFTRMKKGFTIFEVLAAMVIILFLGIALARGILEMMRLNLRVQVRQTAIQVVETWASYIEALPYDSWMINPGENSEDPQGKGGNAFYCYGCAFNGGFCDKEPRKWQLNQKCPRLCYDSNDPAYNPNNPICRDCFFCSFMDPNMPRYDSDTDGIVALIDPYNGNNNCRDGTQTCAEDQMKYRFPSSNIADWLRFSPDWGQYSDDCACRLGNCINTSGCRIGNPWRSDDNSLNFRINKACMGNLKCVYEVRRGVSQSGVGWRAGAGDRVFVGMTVINYFYHKNPVKPAGKAIGIVAWYFDPIDRNYRSVSKIVFKEAP